MSPALGEVAAAPRADAPRRFRATLVPAPGVRRIPNLEAFLPECDRLVRSAWPLADVDSVAGWGRRPSAAFAERLASRRGLARLSLEDGFLRSIGLGEQGAAAISLVADDLGVYYDASAPSRLEVLLGEDGWATPALLARARSALNLLLRSRLSKTNAAAPLPRDVLAPTRRRRVLVVDQTLGDRSIALGLASPASFQAMLKAALADEAGAEIVVRRHPAVLAGLKAGCLTDLPDGVTVLAQDCPAADVLDRVDKVYTVTSLLGMEALTRGLAVRCFGAPFYAGWGATRDEIGVLRRNRPRTSLEIFAAAYLLYARYADPLTGEACDFETAVERLALFRERSERNAGFKACVGFSPAKQGVVRALLHSARGETRFFASPAKACAAAKAAQGSVRVWAARETAALAAAVAREQVPLVRIEDGFVRSRGLGSQFVRGGSFTLDDLGVHFDPTQPSRLERTLQAADFDAETLARAAALRRRIVASGLSKYNLGGAKVDDDGAPGPRLLVVGQVEDDSSIRRGCTDVRTNLGLLAAARRDHPQARIAYKPHPDVEAGTRRGRVARKDALRHADLILDRTGIVAALDWAQAVATMTSLTGFEALLRGRAVWTYGGPFYAGWGLTWDRQGFPRRTRRLTLDQLVAGALIAYPLWLDPRSGLPCPPEHLIEVLCGASPADPRGGGKVRGLLEAVFPLRTRAW